MIAGGVYFKCIRFIASLIHSALTCLYRAATSLSLDFYSAIVIWGGGGGNGLSISKSEILLEESISSGGDPSDRNSSLQIQSNGVLILFNFQSFSESASF